MTGFGLNGIVVAETGEWRALVRTRANVLVIGHRDALEAFVTTCRNELREPVVHASAAEPLDLTACSGTLVIAKLDQLDRSGQRSLTALTNARRHADPQVISLAETPLFPLFPLVQVDQFDPDLFYRLNTVCLDLRSV